MPLLQQGIRVILTTGMALMLTACQSPAEERIATPLLGLAGPWAQQFEGAYAEADSDYERQVLRDGEVTLAEYEQTKERLQQCVGDSGYVITWDDAGGFELGSKSDRYPDDFFEKSDAVLRRCEKRWEGSIRFLYEQVRRNPDRQDEASIVVACLQKAGLVTKTYDSKSWARDNEAGRLPYDERSREAESCQLDPLGLQGLQ
ncbi:hypothetical protein [Frondihabitans cladoniiphilus]|uniref:Lipoprotein n=1 Tax=Frondihabitans cladoniiphilus TaxID=715785 RepID=A0ABP8VY67_9MICO